MVLEKKIFNSLLPIPPKIQQIKIHAIAHSVSSEIIRKSFKIEPVSHRKQHYMEVRNYDSYKLEKEISELTKITEKEDIEVISVTSDNYHPISDGYATILEYLWNSGSENPELFPVERLHGRMKYFKNEGVFVHTVLLRRNLEYIGLYETVFYHTNKLVADESMCGLKTEFDSNTLLKLMKLKTLHYILKKTEVTHWESPIQTKNTMLSKINEELGFILGKSFDHYRISIKNCKIK
jgi:hypothetical protein